MRISHLLGDHYKEWPSEATLKSHGFLLKGGYIRQVAGGIYTLLPPAKRIADKIEQIIREEMDAIGGQEVLFPVVLPGELWEESGRYESVGSELLRFTDRTGHRMLLGMTHEEAAVHLARTEARSYLKYPFMIYQIQTKFRDEARSRGGLIRVREFTMKDAYSFHTDQEDLDRYYHICLQAYRRIFDRVGLPEVIDVKSDTGMMGGSVAHEFMLLCDDGEDTICLCPECGYRANMEVATGILASNPDVGTQPAEEAPTPGIEDMEGLQKFFDLPLSRMIKSVVFTREDNGKPVVFFLRGDLEVNEAKARRLAGTELLPRVGSEEDGLAYGYIGPVGFPYDKVEVYFDRSLEGERNMLAGANRQDVHIKGVDMTTLPVKEYADVAKVNEDMLCPVCGKAHIDLKNGIEVGNIFQLGAKYTAAMKMTYVDKDGKSKTPIMGCYGIGVGRLLASVIEASHDDYGPIWPYAIAPWQVHICAIRYSDEAVRRMAEELYDKLQKAGFSVMLDDRDVSAGIQFADADLLGVPARVIVSPKNLKENEIEVKTRDKSHAERLPLGDDVAERVAKLIRGWYL